MIDNFISIFEPELLREISETGIPKEFKEGDIIIEIGNYVKFIPLIISGNIKISREDDNGKELLLYFLEKGNTCAMTLTCCVGNAKSEIRAVAETDVSLIMIPVQKMDEWMIKYKTWRNFVLQSYQDRFMEVLETVDSIAFLNMDKRLLKYLANKVKISNSNIIETTHQQIADDLNTSRVVISRLLKTLERENLVELNRNSIKYLLK
ncbi:Crp/Fnr family transcriptional regulator [Halpernia frigidisoli]|uniref:CRP/FNR family transcriptional regulator, anaerobic regulatory protein n=1 Tax=Halpernia frigidisoli TaxID=1125876 RepID=A0A1I3GK58_9FLAO|nr:Crp/Fnr family transcriptional regulator [Halpernia frigidisoli]SFI23581.1 CRP/FNR family transcriptional regulator, anaerobic regulatory protein [Halpernia frigidisoli]